MQQRLIDLMLNRDMLAVNQGARLGDEHSKSDLSIVNFSFLIETSDLEVPVAKLPLAPPNASQRFRMYRRHRSRDGPFHVHPFQENTIYSM